MGRRLLSLLLWTHMIVVQDNSVFTEPVRDVWIGKIFSDSVWTFAPSSASNKECSLQGQLYWEHLSNNTHWAVRMLDASAISISGLLDGDVFQYGHPDQCIHTQVPIPNFSTKYCMPGATFTPRKSGNFRGDFFSNSSLGDWPPYDTAKSIWDFLRPRAAQIRDRRNKFSWGLCVPESCTAEDVETSLQSTLGEAFSKHDIDFEVKLGPLMCYSAKEVETQRMPLAGRVWFYTILVLVLLMAIGTTVDYLNTGASPDADQFSSSKPKMENFVVSSLVIFSLIRNWNRLCSTVDDDDISIVHGVKFLVMCFIISFHRAIVGMTFSQNLASFEQILHDTRYFLLNASTQMLDVFFFLAGFLLSMGLIKKQEQNKNPSVFLVVVQRALRIYPIYLTCTAFTLWVQPYLDQGPQWKQYSRYESQACAKYWWHNLVFISTLFENTDFCLAMSWYIHTDFQLYIVSLIIIYVAERFSNYRTATLTTAFIVSLIIPSLVLYYTNEMSFWQMKVSDIRDLTHSPYIRKIYVKFYMRAPPYIIGVCAAYLVHAASKKPVKLSGIQKVLIFMSIISVQGVSLYIGSLFLVPGHRFNVWEHIIFAPIMRLTIGTCCFLLLLIHSCTGFGIFSKFLSHPIFTPLGRLTFHMYLIHFCVLCWDVFTLYSAPHYSAFSFTLKSFGDISLTLVLSLGTTLLIESPAGIIRKKILKM